MPRCKTLLDTFFAEDPGERKNILNSWDEAHKKNPFPLVNKLQLAQVLGRRRVRVTLSRSDVYRRLSRGMYPFCRTLLCGGGHTNGSKLKMGPLKK